jgi:DNA (cytosine-5)-methyltransferase 1
MKYLSVCSGIEAASVAWHQLGWQPVGFSEIEPFPSAILKHHYPTIPNYGDLTKYKQWNIEQGKIELLVGGTPCQSFSVAGLRKGMEDPRGNLALTFLGLADKLKPRWIVWENVPGVLSSNGGRDFGSFLGALGQLGYGWAYRVLDAQHFGVPQRRRRVFVVACLGDWRAPAEVLLEPDCVRRDIKKGRTKGQSSAADAGSGVEAGSILWIGSDQANAERVVDKAGTLNCNQGQRGGFICPIGEHPFTASSFAQYAPGVGTVRASGGDLGGGSETLLAQPIPFRKSKLAHSTTDNETWVEADVSNTLNNFDLGDTRTTHGVVEPQLYENHLNQANDARMTMAVRRLTPVECERLQGFPDNWSRIPWKGKPEEQCPDGPRYKACGNSMAVPVLLWIGERIQKQIDGKL